jgi:hypothetical protein
MPDAVEWGYFVLNTNAERHNLKRLSLWQFLPDAVESSYFVCLTAHNRPKGQQLGSLFAPVLFSNAAEMP